MPWFAVDDGFDNHPKIRKAGNAAAGLFCRLGAYSTRHTTEGLIPGPVARDYGTAAQLKKLTDLSMLHAHGHDCRRCAQPDTGDYVIHDFLEYNRSKQEVKAARDAGSERQRRRRTRLAEEAAAAEAQSESNLNRDPNRGSTWDPTRGSGETPTEPRFSGTSAGQEGSSRRYTLENARVSPAQPLPVPPYGGTESQLGSHPKTGPAIPEFAEPLVAAMTSAGMVVGWRLSEPEWFALHALIKRCGIEPLTEFAARRWNRQQPPQTARYLMRIWSDLPNIPGDAPDAPPLKAVSGGWQPFRNPENHDVYDEDLI